MSTGVTAARASGRRVLATAAVALTAFVVGVNVLLEQYLTMHAVDLGVLRLHLVYNSGVAFGLGSALPNWMVLAVSVAITGGLAAYAWYDTASLPLSGFVGFAAIIAGAAANTIDRSIDGWVTDYFYTDWFPTFNLADIFITCGVVIVALSMLRASPKA